MTRMEQISDTNIKYEHFACTGIVVTRPHQRYDIYYKLSPLE